MQLFFFVQTQRPTNQQQQQQRQSKRKKNYFYIFVYTLVEITVTVLHTCDARCWIFVCEGKLRWPVMHCIMWNYFFLDDGVWQATAAVAARGHLL